MSTHPGSSSSLKAFYIKFINSLLENRNIKFSSYYEKQLRKRIYKMVFTHTTNNIFDIKPKEIIHSEKPVLVYDYLEPIPKFCVRFIIYNPQSIPLLKQFQLIQENSPTKGDKEWELNKTYYIPINYEDKNRKEQLLRYMLKFMKLEACELQKDLGFHYVFTDKDVSLSGYHSFLKVRDGNTEQIYYPLLGGIGDYLIAVPVLQYAFNNGLIHGCIFMKEGPQNVVRDIITCFIPSMRFVNMDIIFIEEIISLLQFDLLKSKLSFFEKLCSDLSCAVGQEIIPKAVFQEFKSLPYSTSVFVENIKKQTCCSYVIGFQRVSKTQNEFGQIAKEWSWENTERFLKMCLDNGIYVVNFEPSDKYRNRYPFCLGGMTIKEITSIIKEFDAFVGIDSCFGHLCAISNVPNLIMMQRNSVGFELAAERFIPLANNITLFPDSFKEERITADIVFDHLYDILHNKAPLQNVYIPLSEKILGRDYKII